MSIVDTIRSEVRNVALPLVYEVIENVDGLYTLRAESEEHHKDGVDEEISMELDRLQFHNVKLDMPAMPDPNLASVAGAFAKELWKVEVNSLLDLNTEDLEYPIDFRL